MRETPPPRCCLTSRAFTPPQLEGADLEALPAGHIRAALVPRTGPAPPPPDPAASPQGDPPAAAAAGPAGGAFRTRELSGRVAAAAGDWLLAAELWAEDALLRRAEVRRVRRARIGGPGGAERAGSSRVLSRGRDPEDMVPFSLPLSIDTYQKDR